MQTSHILIKKKKAQLPLCGHVPSVSPAARANRRMWVMFLHSAAHSGTVNGHNCQRSAAAAAAPTHPCCPDRATCKQQLGVAR